MEQQQRRDRHAEALSMDADVIALCAYALVRREIWRVRLKPWVVMEDVDARRERELKKPFIRDFGMKLWTIGIERKRDEMGDISHSNASSTPTGSWEVTAWLSLYIHAEESSETHARYQWIRSSPPFSLPYSSFLIDPRKKDGIYMRDKERGRKRGKKKSRGSIRPHNGSPCASRHPCFFFCFFFASFRSKYRPHVLRFGETAWRMAVMWSKWRSLSRRRRSRLVSCWMRVVVTRERASRRWSLITSNSHVPIDSRSKQCSLLRQKRCGFGTLMSKPSKTSPGSKRSSVFH